MKTLTLAAALLAVQDPRPPVDFARDVQPVFRAHCLTCHGPEKPKGQFRVDARSPALKGGLSGPAIVPGKGAESLLLRLLLEEDAAARMPQKAPALPRATVDLLRRWIDEGAAWPDTAAGDAAPRSHWAYTRPRRPDVPRVANPAWVRTPIDAFILARLEREGLSPSPEAPKEKLLRRVSLDLTGLPPGVAELRAFLADPSPDAYEKAVDRLLASPHFGERWARPWLDLARYADSNGFEKDAPRSMWAWRDWVIGAFNRDLPYSQFTIEQVAGDMIPGATPDQRIATGFHRNSMLNEEDGVDREEARWNTLVERVATTSTAWLGTTLACSQCHNHKYDPFSQLDFYRMLAFFENADEPTLEVPTPEQEAKRNRLREELARVEALGRRSTPEFEAAFERWEAQQRGALSRWLVLEPAEAASSGGASLVRLPDGSVRVEGPNPERDVFTVGARTSVRGISAFRLEVLPDEALPRGGPGRSPSGDFVLTEFKVFSAGRPVALHRPAADFASKHAGADLALDGKDETGWAVGPQVGRRHAAHFETRAPAEGDLTFVLEHRSRHPSHTLGRFRLWALAAEDASGALALPEAVRRLLERPAGELAAPEREAVRDYYRSVTPLLEAPRRRRAELRKEIEALGIPTAWVLSERPGSERPATFLRHRGSFLLKKDRVEADVPAALAPLPAEARPDRLGLARWLASEENPLTARVAVNRFWEQLFGRGIVETTEDMGTQSAPPTHPELLDWLATEFVRGGWSVKALLRQIVTSATYRQASRVTPELLEKDPANTLLARAPSFRMEAEMLRDVALAAGGLLSRKVGGPSVFPEQPEGIWKIAVSRDRWTPSPGEDRYRRGLYTFWRRSAPYPSFATFDAPSREVCTVRRPRTTTPLQALTLLNDPAFFEAARALGKRMEEEGGPDLASRVAYGFRLCVARAPEPAERAILESLYRRERGRGAPDSAALTLVANTILNLDETMTKD